MAAVTSSGCWERGEVAAINRGRQAWHSGERRGNGSQLRWAGNPSEARRRQLLTTSTHNRWPRSQTLLRSLIFELARNQKSGGGSGEFYHMSDVKGREKVQRT